MPRCRPVRSRTRCLNRATALPAMQRGKSGSLRMREAEKRAVPWASHGALLRIDLELEPPLDEAGQACHDPLPGLLAAHVDVTVVGVAHEAVATAFKLAIQLIQHEVREQWRERAALRGPFPAVLKQPVIEHAG